MQVRMGLLNKKLDWSTERFREHWREHHSQLARHLPGLRSYVQNHVIDRAQRGIVFARGPEELDGISQLDFESDTGMGDALASEIASRLAADEQHFIGRLRIITAQRNVVVEPPPAGKALKRISLLRRRPDVSAETFANEWRQVHGPMVRKLPGILGYRQNQITSRESPKGVSVGYDDLPLDGIVELWFADTEAIDKAFGSLAGRVTMTHAQSFIGEITTYLVDPLVVT